MLYVKRTNLDPHIKINAKWIVSLNLKTKTLASRTPELSCEEILMALSVSAVTNPIAQAAMDKLPILKGAQAHSTTILSKTDEQTYRELGIDVTCDPEYPSQNLYYAN